MGRNILLINNPDEYFKTKDIKQPVIMLNDIFGSIYVTKEAIEKWKVVLSDIFRLYDNKDEKVDPERKGKPRKTIIFISRLSVLKEASKHLENYTKFIMNDDCVVDLTHGSKLTMKDKLDIWKYHSDRFGIKVDEDSLRDVCQMSTPHGFPHCCELFAEEFLKDRHLKMKYFFTKPLQCLDGVMTSLMNNPDTRPMLREIIKRDGSFDLDSIDDDGDKSCKYHSLARSLEGTYLSLDGATVSFSHPSVYDSAAFVSCENGAKFVIEYCTLSFLNEWVRFKGLKNQIDSTSHHIAVIDSLYIQQFASRLAKELTNLNIAEALSHQSFHDETFVHAFLEEVKVEELLHLRDRLSRESFLFLMSVSGSAELLVFVCERSNVALSKEDLTEVLFGICEFSSATALRFFITKYPDFDLNVENCRLETPLIVISKKRSENALRLLVEKDNVDVKICDQKGITALHNVCKYGLDQDGSVVKMLIKKGAKMNWKSPYYPYLPLHLACCEGHTVVVQALLECEANVNSITFWEFSPLYYACRMRHTEVVELLLKSGADINLKDKYGRTPLHIASNLGYLDVVKILLEHEADVNAKDNYDATPLYAACTWGHTHIMSLLAERGADINMADTCGNTPLHRACYAGNSASVAVLLERGASVEAKDKDGDTPLHGASYWGHGDCVQTLLDKGVEVNAKNSRGNTPLFDACRRGHNDIIQLLVDRGGDLTSVNEKGEKPLDFAYQGYERASVD